MIVLGSQTLSLAQLREIYATPTPIALADDSRARIAHACKTVSDVVASGETVYGINTGFGLLAHKRIGNDQLSELQRSLVLSHCAGVGEPMPAGVVRLMIALKVQALAQGYSGISTQAVDALIALYNGDYLPVVPSQGSVGASGDLAPLAHMSAALLGEGDVLHKGKLMPATEALKAVGIPTPLTLGPKEGLALLNGTQASLAYALAGLFATERALAAAVVAGAMSTDAIKGSYKPLTPEIHSIRKQPGQIAVAACLRELLDGSAIGASHDDCEKVQDPYSIRCQPQVLGACLDNLVHCRQVLEREANAVTDNPIVLDGEIVSGGNFHAEPVAFAADILAMVLCEIGAMSERRVALLTDPAMSGLPAFLVKESGVNSGFMIAHVTAAALVSENKTRSFPAVVDSIPTSANQEDHVSMATHASRRLTPMAANLGRVIAIELLAACQGIDFQQPLLTSPILKGFHDAIRRDVPHYDRDRPFTRDIECVYQMVTDGLFCSAGPCSTHLGLNT